jgi:membrane protease YdiL (CAAX protease family)
MPSPRRAAVTYVLCTLAVSFVFEAWMLKTAGGLRALGGFAVVILMWIPALVSFLLRAIQREGWRDGGWRAGPFRYWLIAFLVPIACATFTYLATWAVGGVSFAAPADAGPGPSWRRFLVLGLLNIALGGLFGSILAAGEELGWRGYLLPRLMRARISAPIFWSGVIWGVWHVPLVAFGDYATSSRPVVSVVLFLVVVCVAAHFAAWLRLASGSVWPAVVFHAIHNSTYQGVFDPWFNGRNEPYLAGEAGVFSIFAYSVVVFVLWRRGGFDSASIQRPENELATSD